MTTGRSVTSCQSQSRRLPKKCLHSCLEKLYLCEVVENQNTVYFIYFKILVFFFPLDTSFETDCGRCILCACKRLQIDFARVLSDC